MRVCKPILTFVSILLLIAISNPGFAVVATEKTVNSIYAKASQFAAASQSVEDFDKNISEKNYTKRTADKIHESEKSIAGLPDAREIVRWANNAKKDDISDVFSVGDKYIVCVLAQIKEKDKVFKILIFLLIGFYAKGQQLLPSGLPCARASLARAIARRR